jgi:threonine dehydrogenase-like Zn-dependent dehydrogenase
MSEVRVATFDGPQADPVMQVVDCPAPGPSAALVAVIACGLDITDVRLHAGRGSVGTAHLLTLGRHFVGAVAALGTDLGTDSTGNRLRPGMPVLIPSVVPCGRCDLCRRPPWEGAHCLESVCYGAGQPFGNPLHLWGGLADHVVIDRAVLPQAAIHVLPLAMPLWLATLVEPFAACLRALGRAQALGRMRAGAVVAVYGTSAATLLTVAAALELGAGRVIAIGGPDRPGLRLARLFGAEATIDATEVTDPAERSLIVRETVGGRGVDLAVSCDADPPSAEEALAVLRAGGTFIDSGAVFEVPAASIAWQRVRERELTILGSSGFASDDIPVAIRLLSRAQERYPFAALHQRFPFTGDGIAKALAAVARGHAPRALVVVRPDLAGQPGRSGWG